MKFKGINHLALVTGDMDKTIRFWRDLLGLRLVAALGRPGYRHYFFQVSDDDMVAFFEWPGVVPIEGKDHGAPVAGPVVFDHVSIGVDSEEDLWELKDRLAAAGFWVSEIVDHGFIHSLYSFDPNEIPIEFSHVVEGIDMRRDPVMADRHPSGVAMEGAEPRPDRWPPVDTPTTPEEYRVYPGYGREVFEVKRRGHGEGA